MIETERLILRRFTMADLEPIFQNCWSDPEIWKWTSYDPMNSIDDILTLNNIFTDFWFAKYEKSNHYNWAIQLKTTNEVIGRLTGRNPNERNGQIELTYEIGRDWWNQGFMTEAVKAVIGFFFKEVGVQRIWADHADKNPASGRVMQKCGMLYEGILRQEMVCNAGRFDSVIYAILAEDYFAKTDSNDTIKKLIVILGANGIGKSTVSAALFKKLPNSAYIESDYCRMINPAGFTDETIAVNKKNILDLMLNYFNSSTIQNVIFPYGFHGHRKQVFEALLNDLKKKVKFRFYPILLVCDEAENIRRMKADGREDERITRGIIKTRALYDEYDYPRIDVTNITVIKTVDSILKILKA
ncbi:MAG: GNAT family N-acetyltransferase [Saccharofermentanales bacterium]